MADFDKREGIKADEIDGIRKFIGKDENQEIFDIHQKTRREIEAEVLAELR